MTAVVLAVIALVGSIASSALVLYAQFHTERRREIREAETALRRYKEPLVSSAYDLQSRLFNILHQDFLVYVRENRWERRREAVDTTLFAFAQYFGWREVLRREIQLLRFETQDIGRLLSAITGTFSIDDLGPEFMLWKPEQRAIGEAMIEMWRGEPACAGYLEFIRRRKDMEVWLAPLQRDLESFIPGRGGTDRLRKVQNLLIDLITLLDPTNVRYAPERLKKA